ncbi:MAG: hypothetical protein LBO76_04310 [Treponema sp.]|jgi:hypothetical protein|nr:hypothetical protein [Treponema sp.]
MKRGAGIVPLILLVCGLVFVIAGLARGDAEQVFRKAVFVCLECIGIG